MTRLRARLLVVIACASLVGCAEKAPAPGGLGTKTRQQAEQGALCSEREEGCTCAGNQAPIACRPDNPPDTQLCYEGTRYCRSGVWSGCEAVHGFAKPSRIETTALIDPRASHPQCSECEPECYRVIDTLDPADGPLDAGFATGVEYHSSGAGLTLAAADGGVPSGSLPGNALTLIAAAGLPASTTYSGLYRPDNADVYVLMDQSATMSEETLWLYDAWDATQPGLPLLSSLLPCVAGNQNLLAQGISGAFSCMFTSPQVGTGMFRDIPFDPYATDTTLPALAQAADARREVAFANGQRITSNASLVKSAIAAFGGVESSGDPDTASSQIPALYALATGQGLSMGLGRTSVPNGPACTSSHFGYPCFRDGSDPMIVMITDSPMHNGPSPSTYPYDYDLSKLTTTQGTIPNDVVVPPSNDTVGGAYDLGSNMESVLGTWVGTTAGFGADVPGAVAGCNASDPAADAIFRFAVNAPSGPVPIAFSTEGSSFATTLSVHDGPPLGDEQVASPNDANETFPTALALGDVSTRSIVVSGDTTKPSDAANDMRADYQGSLFGNTCGANSIAPDAAFAFDVNGAGGAVQLAISSDMGSAHPVLSIYDASSNLPAWPLASSPLGASGNDNAHATPFDVPTGSGNEYVSITGDTSVLSADYDPSVLGGVQCNPDASAKDAAFHLHVTGTHTLRFDTEGSSFDTVLSLHSRPPVAQTGNWTTHPASTTHQNTNEDAGSAYDVGNMIGRQDIYQGDTSGMSADLNDQGSCGLDSACGDAVYTLNITQRTTLRLGVTGTGFTPGVRITRADPSALTGHVHTIAAGQMHTCAISGGGVFCWGSDSNGQLGDGGSAGAPDSAGAVSTGVTQAVDVAAGLRHTCAALQDGSVRCWGQGASGRLGDGNTSDALSPVQAQNLGSGSGALGRAIQITSGDLHTCALLQDGRIACWGDNALGQLGDGSTSTRTTPTLVSGSTRFVRVAAGGNHTCAIRSSDHAVMCWGDGQYGQIGDGNAAGHSVLSPYATSGTTNATALSLGSDHSCAVLSSGRVMCWGRGAYGQLGQGNTLDYSTPVAVQNTTGSGLLDNATGDIALGRAHSCVQTLEGFVYCWGDNSKRQMGNGGSSQATLPGGVSTIIDLQELTSYYDHVCVLRDAGDLVCWGDGAHLQLGNGGTSAQAAPIPAEPGSGSNKVSFGNGFVDIPFDDACQSRAQAPEAGCTYGSSSSGESYYFCSSQSRTWHTAGLSCQNAGMQLLNVDTPGENSYAASQLNGPAWIGVKRASSDDWLDLEDNVDFENTNNELVWHTDTPSQQVCPWFGPCTTTDTEGHFINDVPGDPAASDLVDSTPWTTASTWVSPLEPTPTDIVWGNNCVTLDPQAKWSTDACSAVPEPSCGFLGLDCLLSALLGALANLVGGVLSWLTAGLINLTDLVHLGTGGLYNAPHFSGGVEHPYVCEQQATTRDVTLDPGTYYVVVQGIDDGQTGNSCAGPYDLSIADVGTPTGGFMACDDNGVAETTSSVLQSTLSDGDYYLVLKGKHAADSGAYALTVRDVGAVQTSELACDAGTGVGDPAQLTFSAQPGHQYYALLKGDAPGDTGPYSFAIRDVSRITGQRLACDDTSGPGGSSAFTASLGTGTYYAVLKGTTPGAQGNYRLTVGGASPTTSSFTPPTYAQTTKALTTNGIRVATVLSCEGKPCDDALAQAKELAQDTGGSVLVANTPSDVPAQLVSAVYGLESLDNITGTLLFAPDPNPGFLNVSMLTVPTGSIACTDVGDGVTLASCGPGARPTYAVSLLNPLLAAVPPGPGPLGSYRFTLHLQGQRNGSTIYTEDVPLYVLPSGGAAAGTYGKGSYTQDMDGRGCVHANTAPSWQELVFDADVRPDTRLEFYACSASDSADLAKCDTAGGTSTGYQRVLTVSAGGGLGVPCSVITQLIDCPEGYCSPYTGTCTYLEGASCVTDKDCPNALPGSCRTGPSAATLGTTCSLGGSVVGNPSSALDAGDLNPFLRMRIDFTSGGNQSRTPSLFAWEARYRCLSVL